MPSSQVAGDPRADVGEAATDCLISPDVGQMQKMTTTAMHMFEK